MLCSVHFLLESLSRFEDRGVAGGKGHRLSCRRVSAGSLITVLAGEGAESEEGNRLTGSEGIHDRVQDGVDDCGGCFLSKLVLSSDFLDEFGFIHDHWLLICEMVETIITDCMQSVKR